MAMVVQGWAKTVKKLKSLKERQHWFEREVEGKRKEKHLKAWKRFLDVNEIANVFQYSFKKKQGFKGFKMNVERVEIKKALYGM